MTLIGQGIALCVVLGVVKPRDRETLEAALSSAVTAIVTLLASAATIVHYVSSRTDLKHRALDQQALPATVWRPRVEDKQAQ
jgi:hypothetical protein